MKKRIPSTIGMILCVILTATSVPSFASAKKNETADSVKEAAPVLGIDARGAGDIDGNGEVNVKDALLLQRHIAGIKIGEFPAIDESDENIMKIADVNCDGILSVGDVTIIQRIAAESTVIEPVDYEWVQTPNAVRLFLENANYDPSDYSYSVIQNYAPPVPDASNWQPLGFDMTTEGGVLTRAGYSVKVNAGDVTVYNDIPNQKTRYALSDKDGVYQIGTLKPAHFLRQIKCDNAPNVRDLGGWSCDGGTVKYGMMIRGGIVQASDRDVLVNQCGVRTELDLRGMNDSSVDPSGGSALGKDIDYYVFPRYSWYSLNDPKLWQMMLRAMFDSVKNKKPVYFHCSAGADRTGTFACVAEAILGMEQSDIDKDYELTSFYSGTYIDAAARRRDEDEWKDLVAQICAKAPKGSEKPMRDGAVQFALELGFSIKEINEFRAAMIDGTPEILK